MSVNKVILLGNVGGEPTTYDFENGGSVTKLSLATTDKGFTTKDGRTIEDHTEWHTIILQNGLAKVAAQYVHKGDRLYIEGKLRTRQYKDKDGAQRYATEVLAQSMEMLSQRTKEESAPAADPYTPQPRGGADDLPF